MGAHIRSGVLLLLLGFVLVRFAHPYVQSYQFQKLVQQEVEDVRQRGETGGIHQRVLDEGRAMGFKINPDDIQVERLVRGYQVNVKYAVPLDLLVYKTAVAFDSTARSGQQ